MHVTRARARGFTMVELVITLAVFAVVMAKGLPAIADFNANSRLRSAAADLHQGASLARSEAIKRNIRTELRVVTTMWSVWDVTAVPPVMLRFGLFDPAVSAANLTLAFQSNGRTFPAGAVGTIGVTPTTMSCGADIRCPSVRITAGGSALICDPSKSTGTYGACS